MIKLTQSDRAQIESLLPRPYKTNYHPNEFVFRITERAENEEAFIDRFWTLRVQFGDNNRVNKLEIIHIETGTPSDIS